MLDSLIDQERLPELMQRYVEGDDEAFADMYRMTAPALMRFFSRHVDGRVIADLMQETFLQVHRARRTYRSQLPFTPWLYAIARHVLLQAARTRRRKTANEVDLSEAAEIAVAVEAPVLARTEAAGALTQLSPEQRRILWMAEAEELTSGEISQITGVSPGTVRVRLHRALRKLRKIFGLTPADGESNAERRDV